MKAGDSEKAQVALEAAGYDGTPVVIMQPTDIPVNSAFSLVTAEALRKAGFKVEMQAMDWATLTSRRASREPRSEEHTSELQSLMRNSYAVFCLKKTKTQP